MTDRYISSRSEQQQSILLFDRSQPRAKVVAGLLRHVPGVQVTVWSDVEHALKQISPQHHMDDPVDMVIASVEADDPKDAGVQVLAEAGYYEQSYLLGIVWKHRGDRYARMNSHRVLYRHSKEADDFTSAIEQAVEEGLGRRPVWLEHLSEMTEMMASSIEELQRDWRVAVIDADRADSTRDYIDHLVVCAQNIAHILHQQALNEPTMATIRNKRIVKLLRVGRWHDLPWEALIPSPKVQGESLYLPIRALSSAQKHEHRPWPRDLKVAFGIASPTNMENLHQTAGIRTQLERMCDAEGAKFQIIRGGLSKASLTTTFNEDYDIAHLLCHGTMDEGGRGSLVLMKTTSRDGSGEHLEAEALEEVLRRTREVPRIVVLHGCHSGFGERSIAAALLRTGVSVVVAFPTQVAQDEATSSLMRFYDELLRGRSLCEAVWASRLAMASRDAYQSSGLALVVDDRLPRARLTEPYFPKEGRMRERQRTLTPVMIRSW